MGLFTCMTLRFELLHQNSAFQLFCTEYVHCGVTISASAGSTRTRRTFSKTMARMYLKAYGEHFKPETKDRSLTVEHAFLLLYNFIYLCMTKFKISIGNFIPL
jgi:hypothetical protein